ncbi:hypothetical protein WA588_000438 [Blastocystis sp. NMH]
MDMSEGASEEHTEQTAREVDNLSTSVPFQELRTPDRKHTIVTRQPFQEVTMRPAVRETATQPSSTTPTISADVLNFQFIPESEKANCSNCLIYHNKKTFPYSYHFQSRDPSPVSISLLATATYDRLDFIPFFMARWPSHLVFALQCNRKDWNIVQAKLNSLNLPDRVMIVIMFSHGTLHFYVNKLRNLAIRATSTTHFLTLDMDMWPSPNLFAELMALPREILDSNSTAVIVPAMFLNSNLVLPRCEKVLECAILSEELFPANKTDLLTCLQERRCSTMKAKGIQHRYVQREWISGDYTYLKMKCFANRLQEPYLVMRYFDSMTLFDERFVDYGCNKVQWVDQLRLMGYEFYLLGRAFMMDIVHHDSGYRQKYMVYARAGKANQMRKLCDKFMAKAELVYGSQSKVNICYQLYDL